MKAVGIVNVVEPRESVVRKETVEEIVVIGSSSRLLVIIVVLIESLPPIELDKEAEMEVLLGSLGRRPPLLLELPDADIEADTDVLLGGGGGGVELEELGGDD